MKNFKRAPLAVIFALFLTTSIVWAQDDQPYPDQAPAAQSQSAGSYDQSDRNDPPGRAARLQYMSGSVSIQPRGTEDWVAGSLNRPLTISDNVWTDKESRAELNVGTGTFRMGDETSLTLTNVTNGTVQVELHQGTLNVHVRHLFGGEIYEIDTPNLAFTIQKSGEYRLDVDPNGDATVVTVRKGEGDATGQGPAFRVRSNEQVKFTDGTSLNHEVAEAPPYDGFDGWCAVRDKREDSSLSARYVAPGVVGYEDLDDYGTWREVPTYGHVWVPVAAPGWAPYSYGHWIWVEPWGWTWVDDAPWGYAPFHYGRWVYTGGYWGWAPGPVYVQPVYAPALVAWFGGPGWGVSLGFGFGGGFGWCPLGWGEPFYPWYHGGFGYFRQVNISNTRIVNINNYWGHGPARFGDHGFRYANLRAPNGFTGAPMRTLQNGVSIHGTAIHANEGQLANAPMGRVGITPTRNAMLGVHAGQPAAAPPARSGMRPVVSRMQPPASFNRNVGSPARAGNMGSAGGAKGGPLTPSSMIPHSPESARGAVPSPALRGVPRPGNETMQRPATPNSNMQRPGINSETARGNYPQIARNVPRPPMGSTPQSRGGFSPAPAQRNVPRPPAGFSSRPSQPTNSGSGRASMGSFGNRPATPAYNNRPATPAYNNRPNTTVPRPTGPVRPANQNERFGNGGNSSYNRPSASSPAYRGGSYGNTPRYSAPPSYRSSGPSYSGPAYRGGSPSYSRPAPSYGGGGYSAASRGGSYGGGAPAYHGGGSSGGGSYHGGGGSSHGSGGGGGGHASSGGGRGGHH